MLNINRKGESKMLKHVVMWKLKEDVDKVEASKKIKESLDNLKGKINEIVDIEVGINNNSAEAFDVVLISIFKTKEDLQSYNVNPLHQEVVKYIKSVVAQRIAVDYEA